MTIQLSDSVSLQYQLLDHHLQTITAGGKHDGVCSLAHEFGRCPTDTLLIARPYGQVMEARYRHYYLNPLLWEIYMTLLSCHLEARAV